TGKAKERLVVYREMAAKQGTQPTSLTKREVNSLATYFEVNLAVRTASSRKEEVREKGQEIHTVTTLDPKKETEKKALEGARRIDKERNDERTKDAKIEERRKKIIDLEEI